MMRGASPLGNLTHAELLQPPRSAHHMAMPVTTHWTTDMVRALPDDGKRYDAR